MPLTEEQKKELDEDLKKIVEERVDKEVQEKLAKELIRRFNPGGGVPPVEPVFKSLGDFLHTVKYKETDTRLKQLREGTDSAGGYLVPEEFRATLLARSLERSVVRPYATVIPMRSDTLNIPKVLETSHASHLYGGIVAYWLEEAGTKTHTEPVFGQVKLIAKKLIGYTYASDELLADSAIALEALLVQQFGSAIGWYEDLAFLRGAGVGEPLGIFNSGAILQPNRAVANQVALADLADIMARMYPDSLYAPNTLWILSPAVLAQLIVLQTGIISWMPIGTGSQGGGAAQRIPAAIMGMPFMVTEKVPTLGTTGDIGLYDLSYYLIGDRQDLRVDTSIHTRFTTDETAWRFVERVDGQPWVNSAFTPYNGGATLSPFVQLNSSSA